MRDKTPAEHRTDAERIARLFVTLYELPVPTIAAVHGPAIAGGTGLATICDFTLATPAAKFGFTEVRIGFVPALVSAFLALQVGDKRCRDLLLTGRLFGAAEAHRLGLVNEVVEPRRTDSARTGSGEISDRQQSAVAKRNQTVACCAESQLAGCGDRCGAGSECGIARDCGFSRRRFGFSGKEKAGLEESDVES